MALTLKQVNGQKHQREADVVSALVSEAPSAKVSSSRFTKGEQQQIH